MLRLYSVDNDYLEYLEKFDNKVSKSHGERLRPFVGVILEIGEFHYFAPLSSPKDKHLKMSSKVVDVFKIANGEYGIVNLNNMIPVPMEETTEIDISRFVNGCEEDRKYGILLDNQVRFLNANSERLLKKARVLYKLVSDLTDNVKLLSRCCDFRKLEDSVVNYRKR